MQGGGKEKKEKAKKTMGAGHQSLVGDHHRGNRQKNGGQGSVSWDNRDSNVSQRYAEHKKNCVTPSFLALWLSDLSVSLPWTTDL